MIRLDNTRPMELLSLLEVARGDYLIIDGVYAQWIAEADIPQLRSRIHDAKKCPYVVSAVSSVLPQGRSTIGQQVVFMLYGYRDGRYPPQISSDREQYRDSREIMDWLATRNGTPRTRETSERKDK